MNISLVAGKSESVYMCVSISACMPDMCVCVCEGVCVCVSVHAWVMCVCV